jgi:hypothetical protein
MRYVSSFGGAEQSRLAPSDPQYPQAGATIDYWLSTSAPVTIEISDATGTVIRRFSSETPGDTTMLGGGTDRLTKNVGLNRFVWNMEYPGAWDPNARRSRRNGPTAAPGMYTIRLVSGSSAQSRKISLKPDPRVVADNVTEADMRSQLAHNIRVRDLVSEVNQLVASLADLKKTASPGSDRMRRIEEMERTLLTPPVRYSRPGLQAQIQYLYGGAMGADQKIGRDVALRYEQLRKELDSVKAAFTGLRISKS